MFLLTFKFVFLEFIHFEIQLDQVDCCLTDIIGDQFVDLLNFIHIPQRS